MTEQTNPFVGFPKMARLNREIVITEKIDGTSAQIFIERIYMDEPTGDNIIVSKKEEDGSFLTMRAGSRSKWLQIGKDNFGFAGWVLANKAELFQLGPGRHFGEWWGSGIQRGYGLVKGEKRFSLFNTGRWVSEDAPLLPGQMHPPTCCHVVPTLWTGLFALRPVNEEIRSLRFRGSRAAPGFMNPEGVVVFHKAANMSFKVTIEKDESPKSEPKIVHRMSDVTNPVAGSSPDVII